MTLPVQHLEDGRAPFWDEVTDRVEGIHGAGARDVAQRAARVLG